jgi:hypothetical protein
LNAAFTPFIAILYIARQATGMLATSKNNLEVNSLPIDYRSISSNEDLQIFQAQSGAHKKTSRLSRAGFGLLIQLAVRRAD